MTSLKLFFAGACLVLIFSPIAKAANPDALWHIVHERCALQTGSQGNVGPCTVMDMPHRIAVLKSIEGKSQYLLIPTDRVPGMEAPALRDLRTPDYFAHAWTQATRVGEGYGVQLPREDVALAINSQDGRSQNQLHIHVECIRPEVKVALYYMRDRVGNDWAPLPAPLLGHPYRAMRVEASSLAGVKPFLLLARSLRDPEHEMGHHTLAVVPEKFGGNRQGFLILDDVAEPLRKDRGSAEELQDHSCAIIEQDPLVTAVHHPL
ncbi:CDP-diacylglycerol diphosphatase [Acetobacter fallax]|uniref:CDP-diacylglycerol diphosphatase n=1 Tax=Acetobacter fallax TaxID=1737473 RepID=UPI001F5522B9|nr:CDP-diacylglycerol diphosphatase [Acetobacter fallax]